MLISSNYVCIVHGLLDSFVLVIKFLHCTLEALSCYNGLLQAMTLLGTSWQGNQMP
jgi:hypothetical protein